MPPELFARLVTGIAIAAATLPLRAQEKTPPEATIELPKYVVTDSAPLPKPEAWFHAELPGFEILSSGSARNTRRILEDFRLFAMALGVVWPELQRQYQAPTTLLLCGGNRFDSFVPEATKSNDSRHGTASLFLDDASRPAIVVDMGVSVLNLETSGAESQLLAQAGVMTSGIEIDQGEQLKREYIRLLLARLNPRLPAWFEEGLAQLLRGMEITNKWITFAKLEDLNEISISQAMAIEQSRFNAEDGFAGMVSAAAEDGGFQRALARSALMGFPEMFAVKRDSMLARNPVGSSWAKQCYAFVHMGLYGEGQRYQKGLLQFLTRLQKEPLSEPLFKECFGAGYRSMGASLRGYVTGASYKSMTWKAAKGSKGFADLAPIVLREATQAEVGRIKGEAYLLAGHRGAAQAELFTAYRRGERDPQLLAAIGLFEDAGGDEGAARKFLQAAVDRKTVRGDAYLALARRQYAEALAAAGDGGIFPRETVDAISSLLRTAAQQPFAAPAVFDLLADTWEHSSEKIPRTDAGFLIRGCQANPTRFRLIYRTARFCADAGLIREARALADHGVLHAPNETARTSFSKLKSTLPPAGP